jgi:hypothetical protein
MSRTGVCRKKSFIFTFAAKKAKKCLLMIIARAVIPTAPRAVHSDGEGGDTLINASQ